MKALEELKKHVSVLTTVLIFTLGMTCLTACGSDDDEDSGSIVGTWYYEDEVGEFTITFSSDGTFSTYSIYYDELEYGPEIESGTYTYRNHTLTLYYDDDDDEVILNAVVSSTTLTVTGEDEMEDDYGNTILDENGEPIMETQTMVLRRLSN